MSSTTESDIRLPDGRTLHAYDTGAHDDERLAVCWHHGTPNLGHPPTPWFEQAETLGLRFFSFDRPDYGGSSPHPDRTVGDVAADAAAVADGLGIDRFGVLGHSGGGPHALACAALLPGRVVAAASVSGPAPYDADGLDWFAGMAEENQAEYHAALAGAATYEAYVVDNVLPMLQATPEQLEEAMGGLVTEVDKAAVTPELADWMSRLFHRAAEQGAVGVRDDGLAAVSPWGFELADIVVPVAIWQGRQDAMVPYEHGAWLAAHVPGAEAHLLENEGHLSLVAQMDVLLADLKRLGGVG